MTAALFSCILLLDLLLGDPRGWPHPIVWIGRLIAKLEAILYETGIKKSLSGVGLVVIVILATAVSALLLLEIAASFGGVVRWLTALWLGWSCLALRSLHRESEAVVTELNTGDLAGARQALSMIVGRDTAHLDEQAILKATLETVAENASDGVIAPMFYLLLGGPVLGLLYKAANTLDSMVGYRNDRYRHFGWAAARLDDLLNLLPARLTGFLFVGAAYLLKLDGPAALRVMLRDAVKHASPNAGWPEAAAAGALGIQLGGGAIYFGQRFDKPTFGDMDVPLTKAHYRQMVRLLYLSSGLFAIFGLLLLGIL